MLLRISGALEVSRERVCRAEQALAAQMKLELQAAINNPEAQECGASSCGGA